MAEAAAELGIPDASIRLAYEGPLNPTITPVGWLLDFSARPAAELVVEVPELGTFREPENLSIPAFSALIVEGVHVSGSPDAQW